MRDVTVDIITTSGKDSASVFCDGQLKESDGRYSVKAQDGDVLFFFEYDESEQCLKAHRRGGMDYDTRFKSGETFAATLTSAFGQVKTECRTLCTALEKLADGYVFKASYELCKEPYSLQVRARFK